MSDCTPNFQWIGLLPSFFTAVSAVAGAVVAVKGLGTWKRQITGKVEYETARRVLRGVLEVRENVRGVRAAFISVGEMIAAFKEAGIDPSAVTLPGDSRTDEVVYTSRWKRLSESLLSLEGDVLEAEVLWGPDIREAFGKLRGQVAKLRFAVENHLRNRADPSQWRGHRSSFDKDQIAVLHAIGDPDPFAEEMDQILAKFEVLVRPHLSSR